MGALGLVAVVVGIILATRGGSDTPTTGGGGNSTPSASPGRTTSAAAGKTYNDPNGRFSVALPSDYPEFKSSKQTQATLAGPVELNMLLSEKPNGAFIVGYSDFPEAAFEGRTPKKMLEDGRDGSLKNISATLEKQQDLTIQGRTGLGVYGSASSGGRPYYVRFNFILDKPRALSGRLPRLQPRRPRQARGAGVLQLLQDEVTERQTNKTVRAGLIPARSTCEQIQTGMDRIDRIRKTCSLSCLSCPSLLIFSTENLTT